MIHFQQKFIYIWSPVLDCVKVGIDGKLSHQTFEKNEDWCYYPGYGLRLSNGTQMLSMRVGKDIYTEKEIMKNVLLICCVLVISCSCQTFRARRLMYEKSKGLQETHALLLEESKLFLSKTSNRSLKDSVFLYMTNYNQYDFFSQQDPPKILEPILLNNDHTKAIIPILQRTLDRSGSRVEYVSYISFKAENGKWLLKYNNGFTDSFSYENSSYPSLSDSCISVKFVRNFILRGEIEPRKKFNSKIFKSAWYMF